MNSRNLTPTLFSRWPLVPISIAFALGIGCGSSLNFSTSALLAACVASATIAGWMNRQPAAGIAVTAAFFFLGAFCICAEHDSTLTDRVRVLIDTGRIESGEMVKAVGVIRGGLEPTSDGYVTLLDLERVACSDGELKTSGKVRLYVPVSDQETANAFESLDLHDGSRVAVTAALFREDSYLNPGVMSRVEILDRQGIDATGTIKNSSLVESLGDANSFGPLAWLRERRQRLINEFRRLFGPSTAGTLIASLLGDKFFLDKQTAEIYRSGGTFHVLVISGLHITFVGGLLLLLVRVFTRRRSLEFASVTSVLWGYTLLVGAEVPVVRACLMFTILLFSGVIHRERNLLNSFGACGLLLLAWRPSDLFDPSLQLTFASVGAIVVAAFPLIEKLRKIGSWTPDAAQPFPPNVPLWLKLFCETLYWREEVWQIEMGRQVWKARISKSPYFKWSNVFDFRKASVYLFEALLVSLIVQFSLLPFTIVYFHRMTPISVISNLWVGFFIAVESFSALVSVAVAQLSQTLAVPFINLTEVSNSALLSLPALFSRFEWSSWRVPVYSDAKWIYAIYFVLVTGAGAAAFLWDPFKLKRTPRPFAKAAAAGSILLLACVIVFHPFSAPSADGRLHVDFLDVGQGDSALVTFPDGRTMLIDGGGKMTFRSDGEETNSVEADLPRVGERVVSEYLWERGYSRVDYIAATHADADHIQGLSDVAANFEIGKALFARMPSDDPEFAELNTVLRRRNIPIELVGAGQKVDIAGVNIEVLWPELDASPVAVSDNNHSIVLRLTFGGRSFLMTGDIEKQAEGTLLATSGRLHADVIKVPHHGSRSSSTVEFVDAVKPEYAIISVGRRSPFGHPHKDVVARWLSSGGKVFTTGEKGMISVSTDGSDLKVERFLDERDSSRNNEN